jgi:rod shape determining protein RodA
MLYAVVYEEAKPFAFLDIGTEIGKQSIWVVISLIAFVFAFSLDWKFWNTFAYPIFVVTLILLVGVLVFGTEIKGAKSWFTFGFFSFQPSEIAKLGTSLAISSYLSFHKNELKERNVLLIALAILFVPMILILLQPDAGSALIFISFFILLYRRGLPNEYYILAFALAGIFIASLMSEPYSVTIFTLLVGIAFLAFNSKLSSFRALLLVSIIGIISLFLVYSEVYASYAFILPLVVFIGFGLKLILDRKMKYFSFVVPAVVIAIALSYGARFAFDNFLEPHQQERINVWLSPEKCDPRGSLYNIIQSKLAIGSGGVMGKGYLEGEMTKLNFVPEQTTDFIFSTVGEEQGFIGSVAIILLFLILISRMVIMAERTRFEFVRNFGYCLAGIFFFHFFINIGMTVGIMPVIGIPLPFLSKGGSSLLMFSLLVAIMLRMDVERTTK